MASLEIRDLHKQFAGNDRAALDGVNLQVNDGEYLVLLGPSGCGKSTLLRTIAGLEQPTAGDVVIGGSVVTELPPRARRIAMVFQSYALYPHKSVQANIEFPLKALGIEKAERHSKAKSAAEMFEIGHLLHRRPRQLSGGERQRVALARALVREPDVFLLDEPLSNLDAKLRTSARDELRAFHEKIGTTTVYVTHDQVEAMGLGDRIAVLKDGQIRQLGTPTDIYDHPADTFVATFIGSPPMNLVRDGARLIGFRPEHLILGTAANDALTMRIAVERTEYLSGDHHIHGVATCLVGDAVAEPTKVIARLSSNGTSPRPGTEVDFAVAWQNVRYFDAATGKRIEAP